MKKQKQKALQLALREIPLANGNAHSVRKVRPTRTRTRIKQWHAVFLRSLAKTPSVTIAARAARVSTRACYKARDADPAFAELWSDAINKSVDALEHEVFQRALKGDTTLALATLRAFRPERWRDTSRMEIDQRLCGVLILPEKEQLPP